MCLHGLHRERLIFLYQSKLKDFDKNSLKIRLEILKLFWFEIILKF